MVPCEETSEPNGPPLWDLNFEPGDCECCGDGGCEEPCPACESDQDCCICTIVLDPLMNQFTCPDGYEPDYEYAGSNGEPACIKKTVINCDADPEECSDSDVSPWPGPWFGTISPGYCCNGVCSTNCNPPENPLP